MPHIQLRTKSGSQSENDVVVNVQDATFDYLMTSPSPEIRVSAYLDRDWPRIESNYAEIFVGDTCAFHTKITKIIPGSRVRKDIELPGPMNEGEQLIVIVSRTPLELRA